MVKQTQKISSVIELFKDKGISQVPVIDDAGWIKGMATEGAILSALYEGRAKISDPIETLANPAVEYVSLSDSVEKVSQVLTSGKVAIVNPSQNEHKLLAILTKIDLLTYLGGRA